MTYDDVLQKVGEFGKFQKIFCVLVFCSTMTCALGTLTMIYTLYTPMHRCYVEGVDGSSPNNETPQFGPQYLIPNVTQNGVVTSSQCTRYKFNHTSDVIYRNVTDDVVECDSGWVFDEGGVKTVITEFELVCDSAWLKPITVSLFMFGEAIGSFVGGALSDRFGRRPLLVWGKMIEFLIYLATGFSPSVYVYIAIMTISGAFVYLPYTTAFVLGNELVGTKHRNIVSLCVYGGYCTGAAVVPLLGYLLPDWRWLMRVSGLIGLLYVPFYWLIPESPYWLLSAGKYEEAEMVLKKIAATNRREIDCNTLKETFLKEEEEKVDLMDDKEAETTSHGLLRLLRSSVMRNRLLVAYVSWIVTNMVYYGLALNISTLSGDRFWNAAISGVLEYPGILTGFLIIQWIGRPLSLAALMGLGGIFLAIAPFVEAVNSSAMTVLVIIGKTSMIGAFYINFSITGEMSPTLYRNIAVGSSSAVGKIGSFTAPYLMFLGETTSRFVPFLVMGILALLSATCSLAVLPETKGTTLPDLINDAETLKPKFHKKNLHKDNALEL